MNSLDVLIVGAGPTGLTLACDLIRRGLTCRIVEQAPHPPDRLPGLHPQAPQPGDP